MAQANRLVLARGARSFGQGALVVDFALYLRELGWSGAAIGGLLSAALGFGMLLSALTGPAADRFGCKRLLLGFEMTQIFAAILALAGASAWVLVPAALLGQFGRGGNGTAGPFAPVEQTWLASFLTPAERAPVYSRNSAAGFLGMGAGSLLGGVLPTMVGSRAVFVLVLLASLVCIWLIARIDDVRPAMAPTVRDVASARTRPEENALLLRLALSNALQGIGIGLTGPLIAYWFAMRFGAGPQSIGPLLAAGFICAALSALLAGRLSTRYGIVPVVIGMRLVGLALAIALPLAPGFAVAALMHVSKSVCNRGTNGVRQALSIGIVSAKRRGFASSLNAVSLQVPRMAGPLVAGWLFDTGSLAAPFLIAALFQTAYLWLYAASFRDLDRRVPKAGGKANYPASALGS